jgi:hypothetical protein
LQVHWLYSILQPLHMLEELRRITSTEPYTSNGGMWIKEITITPWANADAKFVFELSEDDMIDQERQVWEVSCKGLAETDGIPQAIIPTTQIKVYDDHQLLWNFQNKIFFSIKSKSDNIPSMMGELFIEHSKSCGNWIEFHWLYASLPETLMTLRENQLAIPAPLQKACFGVLEKYGEYSVLFFSNSVNWRDEENFGQSHVVAKEFSERRIR